MPQLPNASVQKLYQAIVDDAKGQTGGVTIPGDLMLALFAHGDAAEDYAIQVMALGWPWFEAISDWLVQRAERVQPRLLKILADREADASFQAGAAYTLGKVRTAAAVPVLHEVLRDGATVELEFPFSVLLFNAVRALGSIGERARPVVPELIALFDDPRTKALDLQSCPFGQHIFRPDILESLVNIDAGNAEVIERVQRSFYDEDAELFSVAPELLVRSGASRDMVRKSLMTALAEQYYTPEREEHIREGWMQQGTAREYFRSIVAKALDLLDGGESKTVRCTGERPPD